jgi:microcystin-dependent protein
MSDPFIAQIMMFGGNFAPRGWAFCSGQVLSIAQYTALFSLLGTTYGGDGRNTFALPDLRGRVPLGSNSMGLGPGLSPHPWGQKGGSENNTLTTNQMPAHTHTIPASDIKGEERKPLGNAMATSPDQNYVSGVTAGNPTSSVGAGQSVNNMQPYLAVNFIIALQGTFPSRN